MDREIIFSGLCSFVNTDHADENIVGPSVILVQTDYCGPDCTEHKAEDAYSNGNGNGAGGHMPVRAAMPSNKDIDEEADRAGLGNGNGNGQVHKDHQHIPYIAFNTDDVKIDNASGFLPVPGAPTFRYMSLDGVELKFPRHKPADPQIDPSYENVVQRDKYWPAAEKKYNASYVPKRDGKPNKEYVKAFLPFYGGKLSAGKLSRCAWAFLNDKGTDVTLCGVFAEEVIYTGFPYAEKQKVVMIDLCDLETGDRVRTLTFSPNGKEEKVSLYIGNHLATDLATVMRRESFESFDPEIAGTHWWFLNQAAGMNGPGPLPKPLRIFPLAPGSGGGGLSNVPCGPTR